MASVVTIQIKVDDAQAQQSLSNIEQALQSAGVNGTASIRQIGPALDDTNRHIATSLDGVRLFSQEFGLRIPRALEQMLSRMPAVNTAIASMVGGLAAFAASEILIRAGEEVYKLGQKWFDVNAAVREYYEKSGEASKNKLFDESSLETAVGLLQQANDQVQQLQAKKAAAGVTSSTSWYQNLFNRVSDYLPDETDFYDEAAGRPNRPDAPTFNTSDDKQLAQRQEDVDKAQARVDELQHTSAMKRLQDNEAIDAAQLKGSAAIIAKQQDENALAAERLKYQKQLEESTHNISASTRANELASKQVPADKLTSVYNVNPNAGTDEYAEAVKKNNAEAAAQLHEIAIKQRDETIAMENEARNASLTGVALETAKREEALDAVKRKNAEVEHDAQNLARETAAINARFDAEAMQRQDELDERVRKATGEANAAGLTGTARIRAEQNMQVGDINAEEKKAVGPGGAETAAQTTDYNQLRADAATTANQKIQELDQQYAEHARQVYDSVSTAAVGAYSRIADEAARATDEENEQFDKLFKQADGTYQATEQAFQKHQEILNVIAQKAAQQRQQADQKATDLVAQYDANADAAQSRVKQVGLTGWVSQQQEAMTRIEAMYEAHYQKLKEEAKQLGLTDQQVAQAQADLVKEANAQIEEENAQVRERIAGNLEAAFRDPVSFIKDAMQKMFFEMVADWISQLSIFKSVFGSTMGGLNPAAGGGVGGAGVGGAGGMLGALMGHAGGIGRAPSSSGGGGVSFGSPSSTASYAPSIVGGASPSLDTSSYTSGRSTSDSSSFISSGSGLSTAAVHSLPSETGPVTSSGHSTSEISGLISSGSGLSNTAMHSMQSSSGTAGSTAYGTRPMPLPSVGGYGSFAAAAPGGAIDASKSVNDLMPGATGAPASATDANGVPMVSLGSTTLGGDAGLPHSIGSPAAAPTSGAQMAVGGINAGLAGVAGGQGIWQGIQQGGAKGILTGTLAGAGAGMAIGGLFGPEGALIGAGVGAAVGLLTTGIADITGESGKLEARKYFHDTLDPQIQQDVTEFRTGGGDFQSAIAGVNKTAADGYAYVQKKYHTMAANYMMSTYLSADVRQADEEIERLAKSGSAGLKASAAQFHDGGTIGGFGSLATSSTEGFIHAMLGEMVMNPSASTSPVHGPALNAINSGADAATIAAHYLSQSKSGNTSTHSGGDTHNHFHIHTLDTKTMTGWLKGGGAKMISDAQNSDTQRYAGSGSPGR